MRKIYFLALIMSACVEISCWACNSDGEAEKTDSSSSIIGLLESEMKDFLKANAGAAIDAHVAPATQGPTSEEKKILEELASTIFRILLNEKSTHNKK